jgi:tetratricopeptide (TPR) repeat protein
VSTKTNFGRAGLELAIVALGTLLLGLTPYPRAFTEGMRRAEGHRAAREFGAALESYEQAARLDMESALPWLSMGEVFLYQHRFLQATVAYQEAERSGGGEMALLGLGESYAGRGDWAAALKTWLQAQALAADDARPYVALGRAAIAQSQFDLARRYLLRALQLKPAAADLSIAYASLGRLFLDDDPAQAMEHFRQAGDNDMMAVLEAAGREPSPLRRAVLLGAAFLQRNELPLARHQFERAVSLDPGNAEALAYLAHTLDELGETVTAGNLLERAIDLDPNWAPTYYFLASHYRQMGYVQEAQAALWQAIRCDPENAALRIEMGQTFLDLGDYPSADKWYKEAIDLAPQDVEFHLALTHFYVDHLYRIADEGVPAAEATVALAPQNPQLRDLLGWAYHLAGRSDEGRLEIEQALSTDPDLVSAHYHLGSLYASQGVLALARFHLQRAVDLDQDGYYRSRAELILQKLN